VKAGDLRHRVTIERPGATVDDFGQPVPSGWVEVASVWANIKPIGGREKLRAGAVESTLSHTVLVRYQSGLLPVIGADAWRINYGGRLLAIHSAMVVEERGQWIIFDCTEGALHGGG
jgi:SPP1 family predicted phage head-tail adaptor